MKVRCIDAGNTKGTGDNLLTHGKIYDTLGSHGGYYNIRCDTGKIYTKDQSRFTTDLKQEVPMNPTS